MAAAPTAKPKGNKPRPDGELRLSQMITTYGPGSLVDLVNDAILVPGLEYWSYKGNAAGYEVHEPRLADNLRRRGLKLSRVMPFRSPPVSADDEPNRGCGIGAVEFPSWFLCPQRNCERLIHKRDTEHKSGHRQHRCLTADKPSRLVPVRFVTACSLGHLDDFPWEWFVHAEVGKCAAPELRLTDMGSGDLTDVEVKCESCGAHRSMAEAKGDKSLPRCRGHRPWLGAYVGDPSVGEEPHEGQRLLLRTASDSYFSQVESALSIPQTSKLADDVLEFLEQHDARDFGPLQAQDDVVQGRKYITVLRDAPAYIAKLSHAELWHALATFRAEKAEETNTVHVRETEYATMINAPQEKHDHVYGQGQYGAQQDFYAVRPPRAKCPLPPGVRDLVVVQRLREVRVLTGFTRLEAESQNIYGEFNLGSRRAELSAASDWLPASEIRGEGFLLELDFGALQAWEQRPAVIKREAELREGFVRRFPKHRELGIEFQGARFYLLHTLAHLLITQVSLNCGYAASAIRERIYCSPKHDPSALPMAGILLSTGSSGSEGTLGGLVEQGRVIKYHLEEALRRSKLCSHDPVCGRQHPTQGTPGRALLGSACHGCLFIAECSCERSNQYLDRALVVPTLGIDNAEEVAFFPSPVA